MHPLAEQKSECSPVERSGFIRQHTLTPWRMCDGADTGNTCRYYSKKEKDSRQLPSFVPNPFPCITPNRTFPPVELFLGWGRHHLSHWAVPLQGLKDAKPRWGHTHPVMVLLGTRHHLGRDASSSHPFPSQALLLLLSLPTGMCCFSARANQGSTIIFTFWIRQGFI